MPATNQTADDAGETLRRRILRLDIDGPSEPKPRKARHHRRQPSTRRSLAGPDIALLKAVIESGLVTSTILSIAGLIWTISNILLYYQGIYYSSFWSIGFICTGVTGYIATFGLLRLLDSKRTMRR